MSGRTSFIFWIAIALVFFLFINIFHKNSSLKKSNVKKNVRVVTIGLSPDYPPYAFFDSKNSLVGLDIELLEYILKKRDIGYQIQPMEFSNIISSIQAGRVDIGASGISVTDERSESVYFSKIYHYSRLAVIRPISERRDYNKASDIPISELRSVCKKVGVQIGTVDEPKIDAIWIGLEKRIIKKPQLLDLIADLRIGRIDCVMVSEDSAKHFASVGDGIIYDTVIDPTNLESGGNAFAFAKTKDGAELRDIFNEELSDLEQSIKLDVIKWRWSIEGY